MNDTNDTNDTKQKVSEWIHYFEQHELQSERTQIVIKMLKNVKVSNYKFVKRHITEYTLWVGRTEEILTSFPGTAIPRFFEHAYEFYFAWEIT